MFIEANELTKVYQTGDVIYKALDEASFSMEKGNVGVILGPSGSGKSTLLNIIGGIDKADGGAVTVGSLNITGLNDKKLTEYRREAVGFIFQFYNLIPNLTVFENVYVSANVGKSPLNVDDMLEAVGMKGFRNRFPRELSGGQQQRVSVARALVKNPELLLCDEPTGALDYDSSKEILKLLEDVNKRFNTTILIITHNQAIAAMGDLIVRLRSGRIVENLINDKKIAAERIEW